MFNKGTFDRAPPEKLLQRSRNHFGCQNSFGSSFFTKNGFFDKTFGRGPLEELEPEPERILPNRS
jgi:hypothetical protein